MEHHELDSPDNVIAIIPARYSSTRLPGKMMLAIAGKPLVLHTLERVRQAKLISRALVATDDERIAAAVRSAGGEAVMTSPDHQSGSDRIAEVAERLPQRSIVVNVQGDEPLISPDTIDRAVEALISDPSAHMATTWEPIESIGDLLDSNCVKLVTSEDDRALYFSRSPFPWPREAAQRIGGDLNKTLAAEPEVLRNYKKHTGIYAYPREYLLKFTTLPQTWLEKYEMLEQLRALEHGARIRVAKAAGSSIGVDTVDDFERVRDIIEADIDIRDVQPADMPRVAQVHVESWQRSFAGLVPDDFLDEMSVEKRLVAYTCREHRGEYRMLVAEHPSGGIVGFADFGTPTLNGDFDAQIFSFYLLPEYQRRGIGTRLFRRCVARLQRSGKRSLCLDALEVSPYREFYARMGGREVGRELHKLGSKDFDTIIYGWSDVSAV